jgi:hypothetical protein
MNHPATSYPSQTDVDALRELLDLLADDNSEQTARYLLSSDWLRENGARLAQENAAALAHLRERLAR